ncbi:MAG: hypothetical protein HA488_01890 [Candidatus Verstraetearchaeota archaeon]|nr:hypothetical protein [Candidatus Verstraetearchaeota archaeon]
MNKKPITGGLKPTLLTILEAEREAETIIENAKKQAEEIINKAKKDAEEMINKEVKVEIYKKIDILKKESEHRLREYENEELERNYAFIKKISKMIEDNKESIINEIIRAVLKHGK